MSKKKGPRSTFHIIKFSSSQNIAVRNNKIYAWDWPWVILLSWIRFQQVSISFLQIRPNFDISTFELALMWRHSITKWCSKLKTKAEGPAGNPPAPRIGNASTVKTRGGLVHSCIPAEGESSSGHYGGCRGREGIGQTPALPTSSSAALCNLTYLDLSLLSDTMGTHVPSIVLTKIQRDDMSAWAWRAVNAQRIICAYFYPTFLHKTAQILEIKICERGLFVQDDG